MTFRQNSSRRDYLIAAGFWLFQETLKPEKPRTAAKSEDKKAELNRIRCPLCKWQPNARSRWYCLDCDYPNISTTAVAPRGILLPRADAARDAPINGAGLHAFAAPAGYGMKSGIKTKFRSRDARLFTPQRQLTCAAGKLILLFCEMVFLTSS